MKNKTSEKLPQKLIPFISGNKEWHGKEDINDLANLPSPIVCIIFGNLNCGKSRTCKNILCHKSPHYERIAMYSSLKETDEYDCIDSELVNEVPSIDDFDSSLRNCLILDDISTKTLNKFEKNNLTELFRVGASHNQIDIFCITQDCSDLLPICRRIANTIIMFKNNDLRQLSEIAQKFHLTVPMIKHIFTNICKDRHDSLMLCSITPTHPIRKNVFEVLTL